jgi:hypothetical protein
MRQLAEESATVTHITEQDAVNDAAAEAAANYSFHSKLVASARVAQQKGAYAVWKEKRQLAHAARKAAWKSKQKARQAEWKAHRKSVKAQKDAMKAAAQNVHDIVNGYAAQPYSAAPAALLSKDSIAIGPCNWTQPPGCSPTFEYQGATVTGCTDAGGVSEGVGSLYWCATVTPYTPGNYLECFYQCSGMAGVVAVDEAVSDEKKSKAAYDAAKYVEKIAARKLKSARLSADNAYMKSTSIQQRARNIARKSRAALERAKALAWKLQHKDVANASAWTRALTAEINVTYPTADAVRNAADLTVSAEADLTNAIANTEWSNTNAAANASALDAQQAAEDAMVSRIGAGYDNAYANSTKVDFTGAQSHLTIANTLKHDAIKATYTANGDARRAAWEAQKFDRSSAAANLAPAALEGNDEVTEEVSEVTQGTKQITLGF